MAAIFAEDPALTRVHVDFEDRFQQLLSALITGFLNAMTPKPRKRAATGTSGPPKVQRR